MRVPETTVAAAPFETLVVDAVEAGRETVEDTRVLEAWMSVQSRKVEKWLTEAFADEAEEAAGSEEMAARMVALKVPTISSRLMINIVFGKGAG